MSLRRLIGHSIPGWKSVLLALMSAAMLAVSFPDFDISAFAFFALVPLFVGIYSEHHSVPKSLVAGWIFGTAFFSFTCWWLTYAPITYAGVPPLLAYTLLVGACAAAGFFPGLACGLIAVAITRFGVNGIFAAPVIWVGAEHLRLGLTGNNWNTIGYSQAFNAFVEYAAYGGVGLVGSFVLFVNSLIVIGIVHLVQKSKMPVRMRFDSKLCLILTAVLICAVPIFFALRSEHTGSSTGSGKNVGPKPGTASASIVAIQPNVPMDGLDRGKWRALRDSQFDAAENSLSRLRQIPGTRELPAIVILPESPMNFQYEVDPEFRQAVNGFAIRNEVSVLFNSAEPDRQRQGGFFNSAVMVNESGRKAEQYDKIYLLPFGEFVPLPEFAQELVPPMVGRFSSGKEFDLLPFGKVKGGVMICFESHFSSLSREYAYRGADILVEMTNDGYLGPTPVLRQHLANAAFRSAETSRPLVRVTNVGVTAFINERGEVLDAADVYKKDTRVWYVGKSDGALTAFVRFGYLYPWTCLLLSLAFLLFVILRGVRNFGDDK